MRIEARRDPGARHLIPWQDLGKIASWSGVRVFDKRLIEAVDDLQRDINGAFRKAGTHSMPRDWSSVWNELQFGIKRVKRQDPADDSMVDHLPRSILMLQKQLRRSGIRSDQRVELASQRIFQALLTVLKDGTTFESFLTRKEERS